MFKSILVPAVGFSKDSGALKLALAVARQFNGHLDCLHVRADPADLVASATGYNLGIPLGTQMVVTDLLDVLQETEQKRSERSHKTYDAFCQRENLPEEASSGKNGPSASWKEVIGRESTVLSSQARVHDLTVLGNIADGFGMARAGAGDLCVGSGRPVLLASTKSPEKFDTIAVAWKDTVEAARAVTAATPLLERAARIVIVCVSENKDVTSDSARALAANLRRHNSNVEVVYIAEGYKSLHDAIIDAADGAGADLLVMGAYGHSRIGEFIFGGFTNHVLAGPKMPVLMAH